MTYHPETNPTDLPRVRTVADLDALPWGGNAGWDLPIAAHVDRVVWDGSLPVQLRREICERAGYLMTGEDCTFASETEFLDYLREYDESA